MDLIIAGVGGQGVILAAKVLGQAAVASGVPVITAETIGMAQRGGMVQSHVRLGAEGVGPLIPDGQADVLAGFEPIEAARSLGRMRTGAAAVVNTAPILPLSAVLGASRYDPDRIAAEIRAILPGAIFLDASGLAAEAGNRRAMNAVMLGALAGLGVLPFGVDAVRAALLSSVRPAYRALNEKAFDLGLESVA